MPHVDIPHDRYHDYATMTGYLQALVAAHPHLATMRSVAKSHQGRDVWLIEINNPETGPMLEKPGYYIDAQIHAEEHATSSVALYALWYLLTRYGEDEEVTRLVDSQAIYILPRINPDGAELALVPPFYNWCGNGRYMPGADRISGLIPEDMDGDGYLVWMRVPDPKGEWKKDPENPDVMIQRAPDEMGGEYFRLYPEGRIRDWDGVDVPVEKPFDGNMNRNFPTNWSPQEYGAGIYPLSEPEAKGMAELILDRPNICGMLAYHTNGGVILRPSMTKMDAEMGARDINMFLQIGKMGTEETGYPTVSIYEEFTPNKSKARRGGLMDWTYEEMGIPSMATELWDLETAADVEKDGYYTRPTRTPEIQRKIHAWVVENLGERGFRPWRSFDHPQLGPVEIGGMVNIWAYRNPPGHMLEEMCLANTRFNIRHAMASPRIDLDEVKLERLGPDLWTLRAVVANHGYLPTNLTDVAIENGVAKTVTVEVSGAEVLMNPAKADLGHLAGRNERLQLWSPWGPEWTANARPADWLLRAPEGTEVTVTAWSEKAGTCRKTIKLG